MTKAVAGEFFTERLLAELDDKPALEALEEALRESRRVGFDYVDDAEAAAHYRSEAEEVAEAFLNETPARAISEAGDLQLLLAEIVRRSNGSLVKATHDSARKFLTRLNFVEQTLQERGQTWADVQWPDDIKPIWDEAKAAGL